MENQKINDMLKRKQDVVRMIEKEGNNEDLKKELKNLTEKIRYYNKKMVENAEKDNSVKNVEIKQPKKEKVKRENSMKSVVLKYIEKGITDADMIATKHDFKLSSVKWYLAKFKK